MSKLHRGQELRGRHSECEALDRLLEDVRGQQSRVLVLRGEAGVGKTTLLEYLVTNASGCRIARAAGVESEMELAFAGLHQLCAPMLSHLAHLPTPQRDALGTAFGLTAGAAADRFLVGLAVLSLLSRIAGRAARHHGDAPGSGQRRAPRVPAGLPGNVTARRPHDGRSLNHSLKGFTMKVVIIGGTGLIGSKLVARLREQGHEAVPASPDSGVNTLTGEGLADVLAGAAVVVDVSNSPSFEDAAVLKFFETSTANLLAAEAAAGVGHHVALSVVGSDRAPDSGYLRAKIAQEKLIRNSSIPYSIVRATQFFEFFKRIADEATDGNTVRIPPVLFQPMAAEDVASAVARVAVGAPLNRIVEVGGPQQFRFDEFIRLGLGARHDPREVIADPHAHYFGTELGERTLVPGADARLGEIRFEEWLGKSVIQAVPA